MTNYTINQGTKFLSFNNNTTVKIPIGATDTTYRNVFLVALEANTNAYNIFDVVFINNRSVVKVLHLADTNSNVSYSITSSNFVVTCNTHWTYGFCIAID